MVNHQTMCNKQQAMSYTSSYYQITGVLIYRWHFCVVLLPFVQIVRTTEATIATIFLACPPSIC